MATKQILIVDDHPAVRRAVRSAFESQGFRVWDAADGAEGVRKTQEVNPDLVILDLAMPVMNGLEAALILKKLTPQIPLLMFTASDEAVLLKEAIASGISDVALKSRGSEQLLVKANALLCR